MNEATETNNNNLKLAPRVSERLQGRNIIAVASGKGGVGKTWFSISLAHALARENQRVLLFDGDFGLANIDIQLGLMADKDLGTVISGKATLNQAIHHHADTKFDILAGRSGSGSLANVPLGRLQVLGDDLKITSASYDKVILDMGAGIDRAIREFSAIAHTVIVVCTDEPTSLTDAYAFIKVMAMDNPRIDIRIVVNSANSVREGQRTYNTLLKACQNFLKITPPLLGIIRRDTKVRDSIRNQISILTRHPTSDAAKDIESIAVSLLRNT